MEGCTRVGGMGEREFVPWMKYANGYVCFESVNGELRKGEDNFVELTW